MRTIDSISAPVSAALARHACLGSEYHVHTSTFVADVTPQAAALIAVLCYRQKGSVPLSNPIYPAQSDGGQSLFGRAGGPGSGHTRRSGTGIEEELSIDFLPNAGLPAGSLQSQRGLMPGYSFCKPAFRAICVIDPAARD